MFLSERVGLLTLYTVFYMEYLNNAFYTGGKSPYLAPKPKFMGEQTAWYSPKFFRKIGLQLMTSSSQLHDRIFKMT